MMTLKKQINDLMDEIESRLEDMRTWMDYEVEDPDSSDLNEIKIWLEHIQSSMDDVPWLWRVVIVKCGKCGRQLEINYNQDLQVQERVLKNGWPKCHNQTMKLVCTSKH